MSDHALEAEFLPFITIVLLRSASIYPSKPDPKHSFAEAPRYHYASDFCRIVSNSNFFLLRIKFIIYILNSIY